MVLQDKYGRVFDYLRVSLTDRCNLNCVYCKPFELLKKEKILTLEEIYFLLSFFYRNFGIRKVRFTGGEPLLRRDIENLIEKVFKSFPDLSLNITTNGILLSDYVEVLKRFSVKVNLSLDTLDPEKFKRIVGSDNFLRVISGLEKALELKISLKINTVLMKGINDDEIFDLIDFAREKKVEIRFIELMPFSDGMFWEKHFISEDEVKKIISQRYNLNLIELGKIAKVYEVSGARVGFISTVSNPFCNSCSRLRITSDGKIVLCMFDEIGYSIMEFLRPLISEEKLLEFLVKIVKMKPKGFIELKDKKPEFSIRFLGG